mmetsp:Transcript_9460/g.27688  ORF Transcript_9460/g.27688 Transcript_9460/m.27688 type:complete len:272 (-) Transcript_9460:172-987(-)
MTPTEDGLWDIALPLLSAIHAVHSAGAALRIVDPAHVLFTDPHTVRLSSIGVLDAARPERNLPLPALQSEDLQALGRLLVSVACQNAGAAAPTSLRRSLSFVHASYSADLSRLLMLLLSPPEAAHASVHDAVALVSGRLMTRLAQGVGYADALRTELSKEQENGRLLRLVLKLGLATSRPSLPANESYGDHPDRYLLRLFQDLLYGSSDEEGRPLISFAQAVHALNKLDLGHDGRALLTGREDGAMVLVSYHELKQVLERSFGEIAAAAEQ